MTEKYRDYRLEELAADPCFQEWVLNATAAHHNFWNRFLKEFPEKEELVKEAETLVLTVHDCFGKEEIDSYRLDEYFEQVIRQAENSEERLRKPSSTTLKKLVIGGAVAASILLAAVFAWIWLGSSNELQTVASGYGEWKTRELPDGSTVELNENSEIKFAKSWEEGDDREVWLKGEAFFIVEKKPATGAKFQVITKDLTVEVLGTAFNVNSRGAQTDVFLEEGSIKLNLGEKEEIMKPGEFIAYSKEKKTLERQKEASARAHTSWKDGVLILKNKKVAEILTEIEEIYGVDIEMENEELLEVEITISIPKDRLEIVIPLLEKMLKVDIITDGKQLIIK